MQSFGFDFVSVRAPLIDAFPAELEFEMYTVSRLDRLAIPALCAVLTGCASVAPLPYAEVASSSLLAPNPSDPSGRIPYRYATPADWRSYNKIIIEPIVIYRGPDQQFGEMSDAT